MLESNGSLFNNIHLGAIDGARRNGHTEIVEYLEERFYDRG